MFQLDTDNTNLLNTDDTGARVEVQLLDGEVAFNFHVVVEYNDEGNSEAGSARFNWACTDVDDVDALPTTDMVEAAKAAAVEVFNSEFY